MFMLPTFPNAQKVLDDAFHKRMFAAKAEVFPHAIHPRVLQIMEGKKSNYQREDGKVQPLKVKRHKVTASFQHKEGKGMSLETFDEKAREVGEKLGKQMWNMLTGTIDEAVAETGNEVRINNGNLKQEDVFRMLEMVQHEFDERGDSAQKLILTPAMAEEFKKRECEWAADREFHAKLDDIKRRKKEEFDEREARRRLVD